MPVIDDVYKGGGGQTKQSPSSKGSSRGGVIDDVYKEGSPRKPAPAPRNTPAPSAPEPKTQTGGSFWSKLKGVEKKAEGIGKKVLPWVSNYVTNDLIKPLGRSIDDLAVRMELSPQTISKIAKNGTGDPSIVSASKRFVDENVTRYQNQQKYGRWGGAARSAGSETGKFSLNALEGGVEAAQFLPVGKGVGIAGKLLTQGASMAASGFGGQVLNDVNEGRNINWKQATVSGATNYLFGKMAGATTPWKSVFRIPTNIAGSGLISGASGFIGAKADGRSNAEATDQAKSGAIQGLAFGAFFEGVGHATTFVSNKAHARDVLALKKTLSPDIAEHLTRGVEPATAKELIGLHKNSPVLSSSYLDSLIHLDRPPSGVTLKNTNKEGGVTSHDVEIKPGTGAAHITNKVADVAAEKMTPGIYAMIEKDVKNLVKEKGYNQKEMVKKAVAKVIQDDKLMAEHPDLQRYLDATFGVVKPSVSAIEQAIKIPKEKEVSPEPVVNKKGYEKSVAESLKKSMSKSQEKFGDEALAMIGKDPDKLPPEKQPEVIAYEDKRTDKSKPGVDVTGEIIGNRGGKFQAVNYTIDDPSLKTGKEPGKDVVEKLKGMAEKPKKSGTTTLNAGIDPKVDVFFKEDVFPKGKAVVAGMKETLEGAVNLFSPRTGVKRVTLDKIMEMKGNRDKTEYHIENTTKKIEQAFTKMSQERQVAFIDAIKKGEKQPTPELQAVADMLREIDTNMWNEVKKYNPSMTWKDNHFRVMWKTIPGTEGKAGKLPIGKRPLQGSKGYMKKSTLTDMSEGLAKGGVPVTYNPVTMFKMHFADMNKYVTAQKMWGSLKETKQVKYVKPGGEVPDGYTRVDDSIARVYFPSEKGLVKGGEYYVEKNAARILNNYLSRDLIREAALGRGLLYVKNVSTAVELSLSPFHAVFETVESTGSMFGLGVLKIVNRGILQRDGKALVEGVKDIVTSPLAGIQNAKIGKNAVKYYSKEEFRSTPAGKSFAKKFPDAVRLMDDLFLGGGKLAQHEDYKITTGETFKDQLGKDNYIGAALRAIPEINTWVMNPLFETYIPRLKIATFLREYSNSLVENHDNLAAGKTSRAELARKNWDFAENRFGEMNFDNLFWNRTFKTATQILFRSVTWKLGNIRATGGAFAGQGAEFTKAIQEKRAPKLDPNAAWLFGVSVTTVVMASAIQKSFTGKNLQSIKDAAFPQTDDKGGRVSIPSYIRDNISLLRNPVGYVTSSFSGDIGKLYDIWNNKDFYNTQIYDPNGSPASKAKDIATHIVPLPFSIQSSNSFKKSGGTQAEKTIGYLGFTKAPGYVSDDASKSKLNEILAKKYGGVKTKEEKYALDEKKKFYNGDITAQQLVNEGIIKDTLKAKRAIEKEKAKGDQRSFSHLTSAEQVQVWKQMTPVEKAKSASYLHKENKSLAK